MERTIFALFDDALAVLGVAGAFEREGYDRDAISLVVPDPRGRYALPKEPAAQHVRKFQPLVVEGLGPAAATGPLAPSLIGSSDLVASLMALGFAEPAARHYFESVRKGQAVIAVAMPEDRVRHAVEMMRRLGARAVEETGAPAPVAASPAPAADADPVAVDQVTVPVVEEQLEIGKRQVQRGGVRVYSHVIEEPVRESVSLREERVHVERRAVSREATEADLAEFREGSIEFHETVEEPVITKRRRVVEEIVIGRERRERTETISDTLRKTEVKVERLQSGSPPEEPGTAA